MNKLLIVSISALLFLGSCNSNDGEITTDIASQLQMDARNKTTIGPKIALKPGDKGYTPPTTAGY